MYAIAHIICNHPVYCPLVFPGALLHLDIAATVYHTFEYVKYFKKYITGIVHTFMLVVNR